MTIPATPKQKQLIHTNTANRDIKEEFVQWATADVKKISTNDLTFDQANRILVELKVTPQKLNNRTFFDKNNEQHRKVLAVCIEYGWSTIKNGRRIADTTKLNEWMHSKLCPVQKKLMDMEPQEVSDLIFALQQMTLKKNSKPRKL